MSTCTCCGHATNSHQTEGLCSGCEDALTAIRLLPDDVLPHVLIRAAGGSMKDAARATGTRPQDNDYALTKAKKALGCSREYLLLVARYGQATHRLPIPDGFQRPTHETPVHDAPAPRVHPRPTIPVPPDGPVVVEWREPEPRELSRAVGEVNNQEEEAMETTDISPEQQAKITQRLEQTLAPTPTAAARHLLAEARKAAHEAGLDYQCAFAELAHLVLVGDSLPDMGLVKLAYAFGEAKGRLAALEALA